MPSHSVQRVPRAAGGRGTCGHAGTGAAGPVRSRHHGDRPRRTVRRRSPPSSPRRRSTRSRRRRSPSMRSRSTGSRVRWSTPVTSISFGQAASSLTAQDLLLKLSRIGCSVSHSSDPHLAVTTASLRTADDVAIAFSHGGETAETLRALEVARDAGALGSGGHQRPATRRWRWRRMSCCSRMRTNPRSGWPRCRAASLSSPSSTCCSCASCSTARAGSAVSLQTDPRRGPRAPPHLTFRILRPAGASVDVVAGADQRARVAMRCPRARLPVSDRPVRMPARKPAREGVSCSDRSPPRGRRGRRCRRSPCRRRRPHHSGAVTSRYRGRGNSERSRCGVARSEDDLRIGAGAEHDVRATGRNRRRSSDPPLRGLARARGRQFRSKLSSRSGCRCVYRASWAASAEADSAGGDPRGVHECRFGEKSRCHGRGSGSGARSPQRPSRRGSSAWFRRPRAVVSSRELLHIQAGGRISVDLDRGGRRRRGRAARR